MSAPTLSLMVVPSGAPDGMPSILVDQGGVWRDLSSSGQRMQEVIGSVNNRLEGISQLIGNTDLPADHLIITNTFNQFFDVIVPPKVRDLLAATLNAAGPGETPVLRI